MDYKEAITYLDSFVNYEKTGYKERSAFKLGRMRRLAGLFGNPERSFPSVHIAGTKGKGTTASFIAAILEEAGFKVGLYTSPHLVEPRERIKVSGRMISKDALSFYAGEIKRKLDEKSLGFSPTFFEIYTLLAFNHFRDKKIDYGVIETGLGGRLDSTNIIKGKVAVLSPISHDHTLILGKTLQSIAREKSGIIKAKSTVISAPQNKSALAVIEKKCLALHAEFVLVGRDITFKEIYHDDEKELFDIKGVLEEYKNCGIRLLGRHQIINASSAVGAIEALRKMGAKLSAEDIKRGLEKARNPARCEIIGRSPYIVLDGAQNKKSARALAETLKRNFNYERLILVLGISKDKDIKGICEELTPLADNVILTKANIPRGEDPALIKRFVNKRETIITGSIRDAIDAAGKLAGAKDMILVTGSFFVAGEAKEAKIEKKKFTALSR